MMDTLTQVERLIELAIIQRSELRRLVEELPQLKAHLSEEIERTFEETEPQLRAELEEWTTKQTADKTAALGVALEAKIADLAKSLEVSTQARYNAIIAEREENARLAAKAEAKIAEHAASLPGAVKEIVSAELARFPRAGEIDQLRKEFAEPKSLNPRGKWIAGETYNKLDLVTINGDSYVSNIDGNTEKPSRSAGNWTLNAARGNSGGGGGITALNDLLGNPSAGDIIGSEGNNYVRKTLTAGTGITITDDPSTITIDASGAQEMLTATVKNAESVAITRGQVVYLFSATGGFPSVKLAYNTSDATSAKTFGVVSDVSIAPNGTGTITCVGVVSNLNLGAYNDGDTVYLGATPGSFTATKPYAPNHLVYVGIIERANAGNGELYVKIQNGYELDEIHDVQINNPRQAGQTLIYDATNSLWKNARLTAGVGVSILNADSSITISADGGVNYQGTWNASTNTPTLTSSVGTKGFYYVVSVAGSTNLNGVTDWKVGDWAIFNGTAWEKVDTTDQVSSVFGRTGAVVGVSTDYSSVGITNTAIGASNPSTGAFTTLSATGNLTVNGGTVDNSPASGGPLFRSIRPANTGSAAFASIPNGALSASNVEWYSGLIGSSGDYKIWAYNGSTNTFAFSSTPAGNVTLAGNLTVSGTGTSTFSGSVTSTGSGDRDVKAVSTAGEARVTLDYYGAGGYGSFQIFRDGTRKWRMGVFNNTDANPPLQFYQEGVGEAGRFAPTTGNLLIGGTTDTGQKLQVSGTGYFSSNLTVAGTTVGIGAAIGSGLDVILAGVDGYLYNRKNGYLIFGTNNASVLTLDNSKNSIFEGDIRVQAATKAYTWFKDSTPTKAWGIGSNSWAGLSGGDGSMIFGVYTGSGWYKALELSNGTTSNATLSGNLTVSGTGTSTFAGPLQVNRGTTGTAAMFQAGSLGAGQNLNLFVGKTDSNNNEATIIYHHIGDGSSSNYLGIGFYGADDLLNLKANGNLGIGTASPVTTLNVVKTLGSSGTIANSLLHLGSAGSLGNIYPITFGYSGSSAVNPPAFIGMQITDANSYTNGALVFGVRSVTTDTLPTEAMRVASSGNLLLKSDGVDSGNGKLQLATHTTSAGGIGFGTDTSLFRGQHGNLQLSASSAGQWSTIQLNAYDSNSSAATSYNPTGALSGSNLLWFVGQKAASHGSLQIWAYNGSTHLASALTIDTSSNATFAGTVTANATMTLKNGGSYVIADGSGNVLGRYYLTGGNSYLDYQGTLNMRASSGAGSVTSIDTSGNATFAGRVKAGTAYGTAKSVEVNEAFVGQAQNTTKTITVALPGGANGATFVLDVGAYGNSGTGYGSLLVKGAGYLGSSTTYDAAEIVKANSGSVTVSSVTKGNGQLTFTVINTSGTVSISVKLTATAGDDISTLPAITIA